MTEPRMRQRAQGPQFESKDLVQLLLAFGDQENPLDETVQVLDQIAVDFIIETTHAAAQPAILAGRTKLKVDDFKWALRKDPVKLGRVVELMHAEKEIKQKRKLIDEPEMKAKKGELADTDGGEQKGRGRGKRKKTDVEKIGEDDLDKDDAEDARSAKSVKREASG